MRTKYVHKSGVFSFVFILIVTFSLSTTLHGSIISNPIPPLPGQLIESYDDIVAPPVSHQYDYNTEDLLINSAYDGNIVSLIQQLDVDMTIEYIQDLTSFGPRVTAQQACVDAGRYIYEEFDGMGLSVRYHNWSVSDTFYGSNIEATLPGVDEASDETYIVCAHYDTVPGSPGADDNAAGTSVVLSAAEIMSQYHFNHTVRFVAFSGEEQGLYGSRYYAEDAAANGDDIVAVLNADMMGHAVSEEAKANVVVFDNDESSWVTDFTVDIATEYHEDINLQVVHGGSSGRSDHASFHRVGYNAIFYFEYEVNPYYHDPQDTLDNMNPSYATRVSRLALATLCSLADFTQINAPNKPLRPSGQISGQIGETYEYTTSTIDPNDEPVWYMWQWGEGSTSEWIGPFASGEMANASHTWTRKNVYDIRVKAKDASGEQSTWSEPLSVSMPKARIHIIDHRISEFLERMLLRFPSIVNLMKTMNL